MKKIILAMVLVLLFSGCSKEVSVSPAEISEVYKNDFSAKVLAVFGESEAEMDISKNGMSISFVALSPKEIEGMGIALSDEHALVTYEGMEQTIRTDSLPEGTPFLLMEELFEELSDPEDFTLSTENEKLTAKGEGFSAVLSPEDFSLISAEFPAFGTKFTFSDFVFAASE